MTNGVLDIFRSLLPTSYCLKASEWSCLLRPNRRVIFHSLFPGERSPRSAAHSRLSQSPSDAKIEDKRYGGGATIFLAIRTHDGRRRRPRRKSIASVRNCMSAKFTQPRGAHSPTFAPRGNLRFHSISLNAQDSQERFLRSKCAVAARGTDGQTEE